MRRKGMRWRVAALVAAAAAGTVWPAEAQLIFWHRVENHTFGNSDQMRAWTLLPHHPPNTIQWTPTGFDSGSGSVTITEHGNGGAEIQQCFTSIVPGWSYTAQARWFAAPGQPLPTGRGFAYRWLAFYASDDCSEPALTVSYIYTPFGTAGSGGWQLATITAGAPATARSAKLILGANHLEPASSAAITVQYDQASVFGPYAFVKGSFLNRGETDLLLRNAVTNEHRVWFLNDERLVGSGSINPTPPTGWEAVGVDDFDGDGKNDLLMWRPLSGWLDFWLMDGINRPGGPVPIGGGDPGPGWKPSATADFNHDGKPDIVLRNVATQQLQIWTTNGTNHVGTITPSPSQAVDANWDLVGAADLNGDGNKDLLWYNIASGRIVYWLMNASVARISGHFTTPASAGDNNWRVVAVGDYGIGSNGRPGTQDIVWRNATSGRVVIWFMDRSGNRTWGTFGGADTPPAPIADWAVVGPR